MASVAIVWGVGAGAVPGPPPAAPLGDAPDAAWGVEAAVADCADMDSEVDP